MRPFVQAQATAALRRDPAPVEATDSWPLFIEQGYDAECPGGGHDAQWITKGYSKIGETYETRSVTSLACAACP